MEQGALADFENKGRGREVGFVPLAGLQPIGEYFGNIFEPVSQAECNIVVLGCRLASGISTSARCQYRSESAGCQLCRYKVKEEWQSGDRVGRERHRGRSYHYEAIHAVKQNFGGIGRREG